MYGGEFLGSSFAIVQVLRFRARGFVHLNFQGGLEGLGLRVFLESGGFECGGASFGTSLQAWDLGF